MPIVNGKKYPYTKKGKEAAQKAKSSHQGSMKYRTLCERKGYKEGV